ncbi:hypothetical protein ACTU6V_04065 [Microbacterium sp. A204]|uniref:hypothetical protein n=1 Tax=Microbacterium sp. A204 TaxID=3457321 RepID=UPI003FD627D9
MSSVDYDDAETTIRAAASVLGAHLKRIPDGEVGKRFRWIMFQPDVLGQADGIERVGDEPVPFKAGLDARRFLIADGVDAASRRSLRWHRSPSCISASCTGRTASRVRAAADHCGIRRRSDLRRGDRVRDRAGAGGDGREHPPLARRGRRGLVS